MAILIYFKLTVKKGDINIFTIKYFRRKRRRKAHAKPHPQRADFSRTIRQDQNETNPVEQKNGERSLFEKERSPLPRA
ncbi:hypothetical protein [Pyramidobacter sp. C12-8]|uniref:hypothetical protein n=1 Tax=Pyramidobacter sp. C12-8 TaxID=1943580 RepID=UPI0014398804|nr:hypothetical protein [Pyramidobacter sp. C12-8]